MRKTFEFTLGILLTIPILLFWNYILNPLEVDKSFLHWLEHYHWGLTCLILHKWLGNPLLLGISIVLCFDEYLHEKPYGISKPHFLESTLIAIPLIGILTLLHLQ